MTRFIPLFVFLLTASLSNAQYHIPKMEMVKLLKSKTLLVEEVEDGKMEWLGKGFNALFLKTVKEKWQMNSQVETAVGKAALDKLDEESEQYAVLRTYLGTISASNTSMTNLQIFEVVVVNEKGKREVILRIPHKKREYDFVDMGFVIDQFNIHLEAGEKGLKKKELYVVEENLAILKSKTLMVPKNSLAIPIAEAKDCYEWKCTFTELVDIDNAIATKDKGAVYLFEGISHNKIQSMVFAVDIESGRVISIMSMGGLYIGTSSTIDWEGNRTTSYQKISGPGGMKCIHIKGFRQKFAQKINN